MPVSILIEPSTLPIDHPLELKLTGLPAGQSVTVEAELEDALGTLWRSEATYAANTDGTIDVATSTPTAGSFAEPGGHGFLWSMRPVSDLDPAAFKEQGSLPPDAGEHTRGHRMGLPQLVADQPHSLRLFARIDHKVVATAQARRILMPEGVTTRDIREGRVRGRLYEPASGRPLPGVVLLSGSGGGINPHDAALLANHGFSVFALAYFNYADLSKYQIGVPLEYFEEALSWFRGHLGHDRIGITGASKGGEGSFVVAANLPQMIKAVVPTVPGDLYLCAVDETATPHAAWTRSGKALPWAGTAEDYARVPENLLSPRPRELFNTRLNLEPFYAAEDVYQRAAIPIENMQCPVLIIWGEDDQAWPSRLAVDRAMRRLAERDYAWPYEAYSYPKSGHLFTFPGMPTTLIDTIVHPLLPLYMTMGGTPAGTAGLQREGWQRRIDFLRRHLENS